MTRPLPGNLAKKLLDWYRTNARILPWRENSDPYRVWISEIMLQQTRVETVIPYYLRFLKEIPDVKSLAEIPEERLLKLWEGLGYYSRAKNLQKAARKIMDIFDGIFPSGENELRSLAGIGEYTTGAIRSIAFDFPAPAVDGNVLRVYARLCACPDDVSVKSIRSRISEELRKAYPETRRGDFTQSLMELGATVCVPNGDPLCGKCPLSDVCAAGKAGTFRDFPILPEKKTKKIVQMTVLLLRGDKKNSVFLRKRPDGGLLSGLWEAPHFEGHLSLTDLENTLKKEHFICRDLRREKDKKHIFTHLEWHMRIYSGICVRAPEGIVEAERKTLSEKYPLPTAFRKLL